MAQKVDVRFVDDLDGSEASGTVSFALDGRAYEIDLSEENAAKLRDSLATFVAAARRTGSRRAAQPAQQHVGGPGGARAAQPRGDRRGPDVGPRERARGLRARTDPEGRDRGLQFGALSRRAESVCSGGGALYGAPAGAVAS